MSESDGSASITGAGQRWPLATYRLQLHGDFGFRAAANIVPYLAELGISDCYVSPYLKARPGSRHGYDVVDHSQLNPEIGDESDRSAWIAALKANRMGQILDVVPNHMAVVGNENAWWNDVLENGPSSAFAHYFDIAWSLSPRAELQNRVLIPILGEPYGTALESQHLQLRFENGAFSVHYFEHRFPVTPRSYGLILERTLASLEQALPADSVELVEYHSILTAIKHLPPWTATDPAHVAEAQREKEVIKRRLASLSEQRTTVAEAIQATVTEFNGTSGQPESFNSLERLLDEQPYRLAFWRVAADEINYRRFFDINDLAALNMEHDDVFEATHRRIFEMLDGGAVTGLRIDHPDGLYDPRQYLERLRQQARPDAEPRPMYIVVEKILAQDEALPADWPVAGTTGYDFLHVSEGLFVAARNQLSLLRTYYEATGDRTHFADCANQQKLLIMQIALSSELQMLTNQLDRLAQLKRWSRDFTQHSLRQVLRAVIANFPVYRTYIGSDDVREADAKAVIRAVSRAMVRNPAVSASIFNFVRDMLLLRVPEGGPPDAEFRALQRQFVGKFQQLSSPVMAKGVEDTAFYVHHSLLSLNEVGGNPDQFGRKPDEVHAAFRHRRQQHPWGMSATSTHDTKRSEDVRARLHALSEMPDPWRESLSKWSEWNQKHRSNVDGTPAPDAREEYYLYQTLLGAWPLKPGNPDDWAQFAIRIREHMHKALQEAKVHTSWINPNAEYDEAVSRFVTAILDERHSPEFLADFKAFQRRLSFLGIWNSLAETTLKIAAPGVPDFYQGTELWDFSLVDPDNRRPVDFDLRKQVLANLKADGADLPRSARALVESPNDGRIKLFTIWRGLHARAAHADLFTTGEYYPVHAVGDRHEHVFSFARRADNVEAIVVVPRLLAGVTDDEPPTGDRVWSGTELQVPAEIKSFRWRNVFTDEAVETRNSTLPVGVVLKHFPVAILLAEER